MEKIIENKKGSDELPFSFLFIADYLPASYLLDTSDQLMTLKNALM